MFSEFDVFFTVIRVICGNKTMRAAGEKTAAEANRAAEENITAEAKRVAEEKTTAEAKRATGEKATNSDFWSWS